MLRFRRMRTLQKFASVHASVHNHFSTERSLQNRNVYKQTRAALAERGAAFSLLDPKTGWGNRDWFAFV